MGLIPRRLIRTPCPGWLPPVSLDHVSPQEGFSPGPLTPRIKRFPATRSCPLPFVYFLCDPLLRTSTQNRRQLEEFINCFFLIKVSCYQCFWRSSFELSVCTSLSDTKPLTYRVWDMVIELNLYVQTICSYRLRAVSFFSLPSRNYWVLFLAR